VSEREEAGIPPKEDDSEATEGERSVESTRRSSERGPSGPALEERQERM
jgi:hypothetical protein